MRKQQKQNADKPSSNPSRDGFNAEELGEQSIYEDETEIAQRIRRGQAHKEKSDSLDVVGTTNSWGSVEKPDKRQGVAGKKTK